MNYEAFRQRNISVKIGQDLKTSKVPRLLSFKRQPQKIVKHTQTIRRQQPTNCLSMFDHFVGLGLKELRIQDFTRLVIVPQVLHSVLKKCNTELNVFLFMRAIMFYKATYLC